MLTKLKTGLARLRAYEPVRLYLYPALAGFVAVVAVDAAVSPVVNAGLQFGLAGLALLLGIPAAEAARARVTPTARAVEAAVNVGRVVQEKSTGGVTATEAVDIAEAAVKASGSLVPGKVSPYVQQALDHARDAAEYFDTGRHRR